MQPNSDNPTKKSGSVSRIVSVSVLIFVIVAIGVLFYRVMIRFFVPLFLAALLVVMFRPLHNWLETRLGNRRRTAAGLTTIAILLIVLIPASLIVMLAAGQGSKLVSGVTSQSVTLALMRARNAFGLTIDHPDLLKRLGENIDALSDPRDFDHASAQLDTTRGLLERLRHLSADTPEPATEVFQTVNEKLDQLQVDLRALHADVEPTVSASVPKSEHLPSGAILEKENPSMSNDAITWEDKYQRSLVDLHRSADSLVTFLLGGRLWSQVKWMANPSENELKNWLTQFRDYAKTNIPNLASTTSEVLFRTFFGLVVLIIAVYFFLADGPAMTRTLMRLSPLDDRYEAKLLVQFDRTSRAVVLATILSALAQAILASLGYHIAGLDATALLFLATAFMALIPFFGALSVWFPCVLWLGFVEQRWPAAIGLAIYGATIVSTIDNVIKVLIIHGHSQLHPLLGLLSVLGGVQVFGPIGLLVGPMIVVFLQTLLEILHHELAENDLDASRSGLDENGEPFDS